MGNQDSQKIRSEVIVRSPGLLALIAFRIVFDELRYAYIVARFC